jgi:hypothetical protein
VALKFEFPKHDVLEVEKIQDDLESCIVKVWCDKAMPARLMKNWKECEESSHWGFVKWGPYYPCNNYGEMGDVLCTMWGKERVLIHHLTSWIGNFICLFKLVGLTMFMKRI